MAFAEYRLPDWCGLRAPAALRSTRPSDATGSAYPARTTALDARRIVGLKSNHTWRPVRAGELTDDVNDEDVLKPLGYLEVRNTVRSDELAADVDALAARLQPQMESCVFDRRPLARLLQRDQESRRVADTRPHGLAQMLE